jgi:ABC-type ATPase with predicted acetyltransferase domain
MIYALLSILFTTLLLTLAVSWMFLRSAVSDSALRKLLLFFVFVTPFAAIIAFVRAIFGRPKPIRYNAEYGEIEDQIERERLQVFGGRMVHPSFSHRWQKAYLQALEKSATAAAKRIFPSSNPVFCVIQNRR